MKKKENKQKEYEMQPIDGCQTREEWEAREKEEKEMAKIQKEQSLRKSRRHKMKRYKIDLPNDYGSEEDDKALQAAYPGLEGDELGGTALQDILFLFDEYEVEKTTDFGLIIRTNSPLPENLPRWAWVSELEGNHGTH